jgi:hypothetical protein
LEGEPGARAHARSAAEHVCARAAPRCAAPRRT